MNKNVELLAPAGTYEAFIAGVENGANAIYMGGKLFNARANASNFDIEDLKKIVEYAHLRNVAIHITLNTLLTDEEIPEAVDFAQELYSIGVDAVIVQDLGLAKAIHTAIPKLPMHASTQLSTHNLEGVNELKKIGFTRVVLARELSIPEIKYICDNTDVEIEIFSHGAMCVSYSGECLFSSMIGDRSGNRGKCAQPCRLPYKLLKNNNEVGSGYLLSPKDLCTIDILKQIPNVTCLKIEGRMKSPEYVATVVKTYRKYIDNLDVAVSSEDKENLTQIFNRGGFSTGYLEAKLGKSMMCYEKPKNWGIYIGKVKSYDGKKYIEVENASKLKVGDGIEVWNGSKDESPSTIISEINGNKIGRIHGDINVGYKVYRTSSKALNTIARESYTRGFVRHSPIDIEISILNSKPITITINDFEFVSNIVAEASEKSPLTNEVVEKQFSKTGNTPFSISTIKVNLDQGLFLPVSTLNELRRTAIAQYEENLLAKIPKQIDVKHIDLSQIYGSSVFNDYKSNKEVSVFFNDFKEEYSGLSSADNCYFYLKDALKYTDAIKKMNGKKFVLFPIITKSNYAKLIKSNIQKMLNDFDGFVISNIGQLEYLTNAEDLTIEELKKKYDIKLIANYSLNTFNSYSLNLFANLGFDKVILSPELTKAQINDLQKYSNIEIEVIAYGNICVMTSEYCPIGSICGNFSKDKPCSKPCTKSDKYYLRDRMNMDFRVLPDSIDCQSRIFNSKINSVETSSLKCDSIRLDFIDESVDEIQKIFEVHKNGKKLSGNDYTNGHFVRPV